jgi:hypothetical protein
MSESRGERKYLRLEGMGESRRKSVARKRGQ